MTDVEVRTDVLNDEEACQLFCHVGVVVRLEETKPFASSHQLSWSWYEKKDKG